MVDYKSASLTMIELGDKNARNLIGKYHKLALKIFTHIGTNQKIVESLKFPLIEDIVSRPHIYQYSNEALEIYLDHHNQQKLNLNDKKGVISLWRAWGFVRLCKYMGFKYNGEYFLNQLALKPFEFVKSKTILLYLPEIF